MADKSFLDWPFFEQKDRNLAVDLDDWAASALSNKATMIGSVPCVKVLAGCPFR